MDFHIDLEELALRESERVEWKESGDDTQISKKIAKTISAFANDISNIGGGYVVCGAREEKDVHGFPTVRFVGLSANKLKEVEGKVLQLCRDQIQPAVVPVVHHLENPENPQTRILVFVVVASNDAHSFRDAEGSGYYVRMGSETREARNGLLLQLLTKKQKIEHFDRRPVQSASINDIDLFLFRDCMQRLNILATGRTADSYLSDTEQIAELVPPLFVKMGLDHTLRPRNFALLLFGKKESVTRLYPDAHTIVSIYPGTDRGTPTAERHIYSGTVLEQAQNTMKFLQAQVSTVFDKESPVPNVENYPFRAIQEAVVNAFVHRDYEIPQPIRITLFSDRMEIVSPGTLHWGIDRERFLKGQSGAKWRNQSFAYLFNKLQLAQAEGQGVPIIFRLMREAGCPEPEFLVGAEDLVCILRANPRHVLLSQAR